LFHLILTPDAYIITFFTGHGSRYRAAEHVGGQAEDCLSYLIGDWRPAHQFYSRSAHRENKPGPYFPDLLTAAFICGGGSLPVLLF